MRYQNFLRELPSTLIELSVSEEDSSNHQLPHDYELTKPVAINHAEDNLIHLYQDPSRLAPLWFPVCVVKSALLSVDLFLWSE